MAGEKLTGSMGGPQCISCVGDKATISCSIIYYLCLDAAAALCVFMCVSVKNNALMYAGVLR